MRNAIFDIRDYQSNESECSKKRPENCALAGGYDLEADQCKTECSERNLK
jgi:hypothetical protein